MHWEYPQYIDYDDPVLNSAHASSAKEFAISMMWKAECQNQAEQEVLDKCLMFNARNAERTCTGTHMNMVKLVQDGWSWWSWLHGYWVAWFAHDLANALSLMDSETSALSTRSCPGHLRSSLRPSASSATPHAVQHGSMLQHPLTVDVKIARWQTTWDRDDLTDARAWHHKYMIWNARKQMSAYSPQEKHSFRVQKYSIW